MTQRIRKTLLAALGIGAIAFGASAIAGAASNSGSTSSTSSQKGNAAQAQRPRGPHVGANGKQETPLTDGTASKVQTAALAAVAGGTVERVETDVDHGSPYEAHVRKSDGTQLEVLVNKDFKVTAVNDMMRR